MERARVKANHSLDRQRTDRTSYVCGFESRCRHEVKRNRMNTEYSIIIAIDPDVEKSGVAELHVGTRRLEVTTLSFPALMDYLQYMEREFADKGERLRVVVEAGWMNASNWHTGGVRSIAAAAKTGQNTGRNHETARKIAEMSRHFGLETEEVKPLKKCWKGSGGKITQEELEYITGKLDRRTNQEGRDAALLAWWFAGLPIKRKV